jgi:hypothetical protein
MAVKKKSSAWLKGLSFALVLSIALAGKFIFYDNDPFGFPYTLTISEIFYDFSIVALFSFLTFGIVAWFSSSLVFWIIERAKNGKTKIKLPLLCTFIILIIYVTGASINVLFPFFRCDPSGIDPLSHWFYPFPYWFINFGSCGLSTVDFVLSAVIWGSIGYIFGKIVMKLK